MQQNIMKVIKVTLQTTDKQYKKQTSLGLDMVGLCTNLTGL